MRLLVQSSRRLGHGGDYARTEPGCLRSVPRTKRQARDAYDLLSRRYDLLAGWAEAPARRAGLRLLDAQPGERVLELGFGTGHALVALARAVAAVGSGGRVYGLDLSDGMLEVAKRRLWRAGLSGSVQLRLGDATHLPYPGGSFDAIFMAFTLELFDTPEIPVVLAECRRVLRPGGRLVVVALSRETGRLRQPARAIAAVLVRLYEWFHDHHPVLADCRPIYAARALAEAGFTVPAPVAAAGVQPGARAGVQPGGRAGVQPGGRAVPGAGATAPRPGVPCAGRPRPAAGSPRLACLFGLPVEIVLGFAQTGSPRKEARTLPSTGVHDIMKTPTE